MKNTFIYLFLVDLCRIYQAEGHAYADYEKKEPGYGNAMLNAYLNVFGKSEAPGKMSHCLLKDIHRAAMEWSKGFAKFEIGEYKNSHNNISLYPMQLRLGEKLLNNPSYSVTEKGVVEFLNHWFIDTSEDTHSLSICLKNPILQIGITSGFGVFHYHPSTKKFSCIEAVATKKSKLELTLDEVIAKITEIQNKGVVELFMDILNRLPEENVQERTTTMLSKVFDEFNNAIELCQSDDEKIRLIMRQIQRIDQIHPFADGNVRSCYILMNKLFVDHGLGFCLPMNPNRLDMCSVDELSAMAKDGFSHFKKVMQHQSETELSLEADEVLPILKRTPCKPQSTAPYLHPHLVEQFMTLLVSIGAYKSKTSSSIAGQGIFKAEFCQYSAINKAIREMNYSLALRRACFGAEVSVIEKILAIHKNDINFEEQTSKGQSVFDLLQINTQLNEEQKGMLHSLLTSASKQGCSDLDASPSSFEKT
ncbi:MAG: Fic family protein [Legionellaceae bacterium]|nr:Fic family protein [Legionellaceae bacterium]